MDFKYGDIVRVLASKESYYGDFYQDQIGTVVGYYPPYAGSCTEYKVELKPNHQIRVFEEDLVIHE